MSWEYSCPQCKAMLNPEQSIILTMQRGDVRLLVGLHPQPGKYKIHLPPEVEIEEGSQWDFSCPVCLSELAFHQNPELCQLELRMDDEPLRILFSRTAGQHATFVLNEKTVSEKYGKDSDRIDLQWGQAKYLV